MRLLVILLIILNMNLSESLKHLHYANAFNMPEIELFQQAISNMSNAEPSQLIDSLASNLNELLLSPAQKCGMERKVAKRPKKERKESK